MQYIISFLEGIITFISPCLLPMLPVYVTYFAGGSVDGNTKNTLKNSFGFVLGFTFVFVALGALAGSLGAFLKEYQIAVNIITGAVVVFFGLHFLGIINLNFFKGFRGLNGQKKLGFFSSMVFGIVFSIGWTPCVGAFLGSALMMASQGGEVLKGVLMLLLYSLGLGIPFVISAMLIDRLKTAFNFIKSHYMAVNRVCGVLLILVGIMMMSGLMGKIFTVLG